MICHCKGLRAFYITFLTIRKSSADIIASCRLYPCTIAVTFIVALEQSVCVCVCVFVCVCMCVCLRVCVCVCVCVFIDL